jgi:hypothetical protein
MTYESCYHLTFWDQLNAGNLNQAKKAKLHKTLKGEEIDVFCVLEANVTEENI